MYISRKASLVAAVVMTCIIMWGCSDAKRAAMLAANKPHIIKQWSGNVQIGQWESTGIVQADESGAGGYYFEDASTRTIVEVTGTLQISIKPSAQ